MYIFAFDEYRRKPSNANNDYKMASIYFYYNLKYNYYILLLYIIPLQYNELSYIFRANIRINAITSSNMASMIHSLIHHPYIQFFEV